MISLLLLLAFYCGEYTLLSQPFLPVVCPAARLRRGHGLVALHDLAGPMLVQVDGLRVGIHLKHERDHSRAHGPQDDAVGYAG